MRVRVEKESVEKDEQTIDAMDTKSSFISGFIVRQLVKEGVIDDTGQIKVEEVRHDNNVQQMKTSTNPNAPPSPFAPHCRPVLPHSITSQDRACSGQMKRYERAMMEGG